MKDSPATGCRGDSALPRGGNRSHSRLRGLLLAWLSVLVVGGQLAAAPPALAAFPGIDGRLVFAAADPDFEIYTINADGSGRKQLTNNEPGIDENSPAWSPDSSRIAFTRSNAFEGAGVPNIWVMNADGSGQVHLLGTPFEGAGDPTWLPNGRIGFAMDGDIWTMDADGSDQVNVTNTQFVSESAPRWSPDGTKIAFVEPGEIWIMNADGSGATFLTNANEDVLSWSPDGSKVAFSRGGQVWVIKPDGSEETQLSDSGSWPSWSPGGTHIAFTSTRDGNAELYIMNADGSAQTRITHTQVGEIFVDWQSVNLALSVSSTRVLYKRSVYVTAHLVPFETTPNPIVSIYQTPYGGTKTLVASAPVDPSGNLTVAVTMYRRSTFVAEWSGDVDHPAGAVSPTRTVYVYALVRGKLSGYYATSGKYRLYHYTSNCPNFYKGCPTYTAMVVPNHHGKYVYITLQGYLSGAWRTVDSFRVRLNSQSKRTVVFVYGNRKIIGIRWRVHVQFKGDADHLGRTSPWSYFKVTS